MITALDKAPGQLKVVYLTDTSAGADAVLAKKDIADVKAMKGKKVAATLGQCNQLLLEKALEKAGLTEKDIKLVNMNPDDAGAAFAAGQDRRRRHLGAVDHQGRRATRRVTSSSAPRTRPT